MRLPWPDAKNECRKRHADLVDIRSKEENDFIVEHFWAGLIGLNDFSEEGNYTWVDGTEATWANWAISEGNAHNERCAFITYAGWYDVECYRTDLKFICKKSLGKFAFNHNEYHPKV